MKLQLENTWETQASYALQDVWYGGTMPKSGSIRMDWLDSLEDSIPTLKEVGGAIPERDLRMLFALTGFIVTVNSRDIKYTDVLNTLVRKQRDYGHENINKHGLTGIAVRLSDKVARLRNLKLRGTEPQNESLVDTMVDIIGYATIALMVIDGTFNTELAS